jgi:hypothetical protein
MAGVGISEAGTIDELLAECERRGWTCGVRRTRTRGAAEPALRATRIYEASVLDRAGKAVVVCSIDPRLALRAAMDTMLRDGTHRPAAGQGSPA